MSRSLSGTRERTHLFYALLIVALALGPYLQTCTFEFAYDDVLQITLNPQVLEGHTFFTLLTSPTPPGNLYRPVTTYSYTLNYWVADLDPGFYHFTNCILYALCCLALYFFASKLITQSKAAAAAAIFALHPLHSEVVANVIGRGEILSALFAFVALRLYLSASQLSLAGTAFFFILSGLSKEGGFGLLLLLPFLGAGVSNDISVRSFGRFLAVSIAVAISYGTLRWAALGANFRVQSDSNVIWAENPISHLSFLERFIPALKTLGDYLRLMVLPVHQSADYSSMPEVFLSRVYSWNGGLSLLILVAFIAAIPRLRPPHAKLFAAWVLCGFLLTSNILTPIGTIMGERLAFLSSAGAALLFATLLGGNQLFVATVALSCTYTALLLSRIPVWRNNLVLFNQTVLDAPQSPKARYNLGIEYLIGKDRDLVLAEKLFRETLQLNPVHLFSMKCLADIALERRELGRVEFWYRKILVASPNDQTIRDQLESLLKLRTSPPP